MAAEAPVDILVQQPLQQAARILRQEGGKLQLRGQDVLILLLAVPRLEGCLSGEHLVHEDPDRPPVRGAPVSPLAHDLRRHVLRRAAEGARRHVVRHTPPCEAEVSEAHVPAGIQQNVLRLEVAMDDAVRVQMRDGQHDLRRVVPRHLFREHAVAVQLEEEVSAIDEVEHKVQLRGGGEGVTQRHDVWVPHLGEDVPLGEGVTEGTGPPGG
mmetsp:Transcript_40823/g.68384  ORF Transcript_40823/g.68384 Transcript_40823/m.68384 type:complete len:211 (+) Transcript_40823:685-1317(+)